MMNSALLLALNAVALATVVTFHFQPTSTEDGAQISQAMLGHNNLCVVLGVVDVRAHRHDARDIAIFGHRRRDKERQVAVAGKVAAAANTIHHA